MCCMIDISILFRPVEPGFSTLLRASESKGLGNSKVSTLLVRTQAQTVWALGPHGGEDMAKYGR